MAADGIEWVCDRQASGGMPGGGHGEGQDCVCHDSVSAVVSAFTLLCLISSRMASREPGAALNAGHFMVVGQMLACGRRAAAAAGLMQGIRGRAKRSADAKTVGYYNQTEATRLRPPSLMRAAPPAPPLTRAAAGHSQAAAAGRWKRR